MKLERKLVEKKKGNLQMTGSVSNKANFSTLDNLGIVLFCLTVFLGNGLDVRQIEKFMNMNTGYPNSMNSKNRNSSLLDKQFFRATANYSA